jgi:hypothetical protein
VRATRPHPREQVAATQLGGRFCCASARTPRPLLLWPAAFALSIAEAAPGSWPAGLQQLKADVTAFARSFPVVGFDSNTMKYKD